MARTRYKILKGDTNPYFITATVVDWIPVFNNPKMGLLVLNTLRFLQVNNRLAIYAFVLMENHIHLIVSSEDLSRQIASFKSYSASRCIDYFKEQADHDMLEQLAIHKPTYRTERSYRFWQEGIQPKRIMGDKMMQQKIEYIHQNPVRKEYVIAPEDWEYSSARNYLGMAGLLDICVDW